MKTRIVTVGIIRDEHDRYLICKMADNHGVYPGQWGIVGGGMEPGETVEESMKREIREETGLTATKMEKLFFETDHRVKQFRTGETEEQYLIYLMFDVHVNGKITLNDEWTEYAFVNAEELANFDLNDKTRETFQKLGILQ